MPVEKPIYSNTYNPMSPALFGKPNSKGMKNAVIEPVEFSLGATTGDAPLMIEEEQDQAFAEAHYDNLAGELEEKFCTRIGLQCKSWFEKDLESRAEWEDTIVKGINNLGLNVMSSEDADAPFEGACMAVHPLILETAVKFQSKATAELLPATGPVRTEVLGKQSEEVLNRANRVKEFMNYQITKKMTEYYPDMEKLLFYLPLYGSAFKKTYWDFTLNRPVSCFIPAQDFVINNNARSLEKARRYAEVLPVMSGSELKNRIVNGEYLEPKEWRGKVLSRSSDEIDVSGDFQVMGESNVTIDRITQATNTASGQQYIDGTFDKAFQLVEMHCYLSLPSPYGTSGHTDPYIVTFIKDTGEILCIKRNWDEDDINRNKKIWFSHYLYVPSFGFYGAGLFHLLGNFQVTLTSVVRSLVDAGQFANLQGGLKLKGVRITGDNTAIAPGEWRETESALQDISKALFPLPYKEPSQVLFALLQWMDGRAGAFADSTEQVVQDSTNYGPVGTTVALLEASMKLFSAIHKRVHFSQEQDLKLLQQVNFDYMPDEYPYDVPGGEKEVFKTDFDPKTVNVVPVSDPNVISNAHRLAIAQTKLQAAMQAPQIHNLKHVYRQFYLALGEENIDDLIAPDAQAQPLSPLEDILAIVQGKPIKAFMGQDHKAHVEFKMTWLQDPLVGGASQTMQSFVPHIMANIREHQLIHYQEQINGLQAEQGTPPNADPKVIAQIQAQAAAEIKKANEALASTLGGNEPMQMIAQAEMLKAQTESERVKHVKVKDLADLSIKAQKVDIDRVEAMLKAKEMGTNAQIEQFKAGTNAVQMGLQNLLREHEINQRNKVENRRADIQLLQGERNRLDKSKTDNKKKKK